MTIQWTTEEVYFHYEIGTENLVEAYDIPGGTLFSLKPIDKH